MPDIAIVNTTVAAEPKDYRLTGGQELQVKAVRAVVDGTSATSAFLPTLQLLAPDGTVMWEGFPPQTVAAGGSADVSWFPGLDLTTVEAGAAAGVTVETFYVDSKDSTGTTSATTLVSGVTYLAQVEGTVSFWDHALDVGTPEAVAMFPSSGARVSTQVGADADTLFAYYSGGGGSPVIGHATFLVANLGSGFLHREPEGGPYSTPVAGHLYRYELTGQGSTVTFKVVDTGPYSDNYGKFKVTLQLPGGSGTGSGAGALVPPTDTTLNGKVLAVAAGIAAWSDVDGGAP